MNERINEQKTITQWKYSFTSIHAEVLKVCSDMTIYSDALAAVPGFPSNGKYKVSEREKVTGWSDQLRKRGRR